jgi:ATP-dependent RNA helicase DDX46/PRP5
MRHGEKMSVEKGTRHTPVRQIEEEGPKIQRERERQQSRKDREVEMVLSNEKQ